MKNDDAGYAFPRPMSQFSEDKKFTAFYDEQEGITIRDYFAAKALVGMLSNGGKKVAEAPDGSLYEPMAHHAYKFADAMLKEREK